MFLGLDYPSTLKLTARFQFSFWRKRVRIALGLESCTKC